MNTQVRYWILLDKRNNVAAISFDEAWAKQVAETLGYTVREGGKL